MSTKKFNVCNLKNGVYASQELLDDQARMRLEAKEYQAVSDNMAIRLQDLAETHGEKIDRQVLFETQVKWAFSRAVGYVRVKGIQEDVAKTISSTMIRELERLPDCCVTCVRVDTDHSGTTSLTAEGFDGRTKLGKTIEISDYYFELNYPNFNPIKDPEFTTIEEDMLEVLLDD